MDWFSKLEQRRQIAITLLVVVAIAILSTSALREPFALDSYWHLKMGQDLIEKGFSPYQDHYSITHRGEPITSVPVPFQVILYSIVDLVGVNTGFRVIVLLSQLLVLGFALVWLRQNRAPAVAIGIVVAWLMVLLLTRAMVRPEIFSYSLMILALILYERTRLNPSNINYLLVALLLLGWSNYHSAILGYVILFGLFVDLAYQQIIEKQPLKRWLLWAAWGLVALAVGYAHRDLYHPAVGFLLQQSGMEPWVAFIDEYRPALLGTVKLATLMLIPLSVVTLAFLLHLRLFGYFVVCAVMAWYGITMDRMTTPGGIVVACLFGMAVSRYDIRAWVTRGAPLIRVVVSASVLLLFSSAIIVSVLQTRALLKANETMLGYFPDQLVKYMQKTNKQGRIFNEYRIGGYLIWHLGDTSRVYIDGRTNILYPYDHVLRWSEALVSPSVLREEIEKHDIDFVILGNRRNFVDVVAGTGVMTLDFADLRYSLYVREGGNFPIAGELWGAPWCWNDGLAAGLAAEVPKAQRMLPAYSPITHLIDLADGYYQSSDKKAFLDVLGKSPTDGQYDDNLRFAAYRALELGLNDRALEWFRAVRVKSFKDYLGGALANQRAGRVDQAEEILFQSSQEDWNLSDINDVRMLYVLLSEIKELREYKYLPSDYLDQVGEMAGYPTLPPPVYRNFASIYCRQS